MEGPDCHSNPASFHSLFLSSFPLFFLFCLMIHILILNPLKTRKWSDANQEKYSSRSLSLPVLSHLLLLLESRMKHLKMRDRWIPLHFASQFDHLPSKANTSMGNCSPSFSLSFFLSMSIFSPFLFLLLLSFSLKYSQIRNEMNFHSFPRVSSFISLLSFLVPLYKIGFIKQTNEHTSDYVLWKLR